MKSILKLSIVLLTLGVLTFSTSPIARAAPLGICVSNVASGNWNTAASWTCFGVAGNQYPDDATKDAFIQSGHTITVDAATTAGSITVEGTLNGSTNTLTAQNVSVRGAFNTASGATTTVNNLTIETAGSVTVNNTLQVNGDLSNGGTLNAGTGTITFAGSAAQTIGGANAISFNNLTINKSANNVTLGNNATVAGILTLTQGDLMSGGNTLTMSSSATTAGNYDVVGTVKRANPSAGALSYGSQFTTLDFSSAVTGDVNVTMQKAAPTGLGAKYVERRYALSVPGGNTANVRLHYRDSELRSAPDETLLRLWRYDNAQGKWILQGISSASTAGADDNWVQRASVSTFSEWGISQEAAPTLVRLEAFDGINDSASNGAVIVALLLAGVIGAIVLARRVG